jgi:glutathione S-transferase
MDVLSLAIRAVLWEVELRTYYAQEPVPQAELTDALGELEAALEGWEALLEPGGSITCAFSIADIAATARMWLVPKLPLDLARMPKTQQMLDVVGARPALRAAL